MTQDAACCVWDFTLKEDEITPEDIIERLSRLCKWWIFQLEMGETTGYRHYQGRISLREKQRLATLKERFGFPEARLSKTVTKNMDDTNYVSKNETRVAGPWSSDMLKMPKHVKEMTTLRPWQQTIVDSASEYDPRRIDLVLDTRGNQGKSALCAYLRCHKIGRGIPFCNDYRDLLRMVMDMPKAPLYIIDMPRAISKERLNQLWSAIETVKSGYAYDDRYHFKEMDFDRPRIWVFTNVPPDTTMLSIDMWKFWEISSEGVLTALRCNTGSDP